ncbi:MAG TPA: aminotransferase class IV [Jatrophihabitantaceae bacterium]|nr:aminotransferase class IV [Jatrophihabitantaceae bacterium]
MSVRLLAVFGVGIVDPATPVVAADDPGLTRGDGCFEGCRVRTSADGHSAVDKLDAHLARMGRSAAALEIAFDDDAWRAFVLQTLAAWTEPGEWAMKLLLTRGAPGGAPTGLLTISPLPANYPAQRRDGIAVITLPRGYAADAFADAPWLLGGVKTLSYAVNMAAQREAARREADDVIFTSSEGLVLEAHTSSVVWLSGGTLHTTPQGPSGILGGTTQALLFECAAAAGRPVVTAPATVADLHAADSLWLIGSVRGPVDVVRLDGKPRGRDEARTAEIRALCGF